MVGAAFAIVITVFALGDTFKFTGALAVDAAIGAAFKGSVAAIAVTDAGPIAGGAESIIAIGRTTDAIGGAGLTVGLAEFGGTADAVVVTEEVAAAFA